MGEAIMFETDILSGSKLELWDNLVQHGSEISGNELSDELKHYLITVFDRTFQRTDERKSFLEGSVVIMLSEAQSREGFEKLDALRYVGDSCILRAGFSKFVSRSFKRVESNPKQYYINLGVTSFAMLYGEYENRKKRQKGSTYKLVASNLPTIVDVVSSIENHEVIFNHIHEI